MCVVGFTCDCEWETYIAFEAGFTEAICIEAASLALYIFPFKEDYDDDNLYDINLFYLFMSVKIKMISKDNQNQ